MVYGSRSEEGQGETVESEHRKCRTTESSAEMKKKNCEIYSQHKDFWRVRYITANKLQKLHIFI
jgi:hypothetical protein